MKEALVKVSISKVFNSDWVFVIRLLVKYSFTSVHLANKLLAQVLDKLSWLHIVVKVTAVITMPDCP